MSDGAAPLSGLAPAAECGHWTSASGRFKTVDLMRWIATRYQKA
jgi:hypothetical protein